jgi:hypothetical protein
VQLGAQDQCSVLGCTGRLVPERLQPRAGA